MQSDVMRPADLDPASDTPQRALIDRRAELEGAIDVLLQRAQVEVLCMQRDLEPFGLSYRAPVQCLENLLATRRDARVRMLVDDGRWLESQAARLRALQRRFSHSLELRLASADDAVGDDAVLIVDQRHVLNVRIGKLVQGDVWLQHPLAARTWTAVFERRWEHAGHNLPVAPLGL